MTDIDMSCYEEGNLLYSNLYREFTGSCTQCGHCIEACTSLTTAGMSLGGIAKALLEAQRKSSNRQELAINLVTDLDLVQAVRGCFFCTSCKNTCFAHNDVCNLIYHARVDFQNLGLIPRDTYSSVMVDGEWDIFTAYRAIYGIDLTDLTRHIETEAHGAESDCKAAFFPGCSLAAYGPELTREIFETIEGLAGKTTMIDHCCGSPLKSAGFYDRAEALCDRNAAEIKASGATKLICVCPGCANAMKATLQRLDQHVEVITLAQFLSENGYEGKKPLPDVPLYLSKSCQDRDGSVLEYTCDALEIDYTTPEIFHGCCGAGGAVSSYDPDRQACQADSKLSFAPDGSLVISMCPTCTYTYAFRLLGNGRDIQNKHYAELLFENQFDWPKVFAQLEGMYTGEYGPWVAQVFA